MTSLLYFLSHDLEFLKNYFVVNPNRSDYTTTVVFSILQNCPVDEILAARNQVTGCIKGSVLVEKLKVSRSMLKNEQTFFNTVLGRYLMEKCAV